jgi:hypothetical protein
MRRGPVQGSLRPVRRARRAARIPTLWSLRPGWDEDTFSALVEVLYDLVTRPREPNFHDYDGCGWHYTAFTTETGRSLYRWKIHQLLDACALMKCRAVNCASVIPGPAQATGTAAITARRWATSQAISCLATEVGRPGRLRCTRRPGPWMDCVLHAPN